MNEAPRSLLARHGIGVVQTLGALACLLVLATGCSLSGSGNSATQPAYPRCAGVLAQALISPNTPVAGSYACIDPGLASASHITSDVDMQTIAQQAPVYTAYRYVGHTTNGYYFEFSTSTDPACVRLHFNLTGHLDHANHAAGVCPQPLP
jgi:hypothetical protein